MQRAGFIKEAHVAKKRSKDVPKLTRVEKTNPVFSTYFPDVRGVFGAQVLQVAGAAMFRKGPVPGLKPKDVLKMTSVFVGPIGQVVIVEVGSLGKNILPSAVDLLRVRDSIAPVVTKLSRTAPASTPCYATEWVFYPPIVQVAVGGTLEKPKVVMTLGDRERHIIPSKHDVLAMRKLLDPLFKRMRPKGMKPVEVVYKSC